MASNSSTAINAGRRLPKTSSRCRTESVTATHDFEVADYRLLDGMGVGKHVRSSTFTVGGYDWCILFFPDGSKKQGLYASAFLRCLNPAKNVRGKFTLSMLAEEFVEVTRPSRLLHHTFSRAVDDWGFTEFVEKSRLRLMTDASDILFTIRCVLTVIQDPRTTEGTKRKAVAVPPPNLQEQLEHLRKDGGCADVALAVSGQVFDAHRCVLAARSPVFKAELFGSMKEKTTQRIKIDDIEPQIFEALLHFIYTDALLHGEDGESAPELQHLLVAADRYGIERLRLLCEAQLCESIDVETAATTLVLAEQHHCHHLRDACVEFMASPEVLRAVLATDGFKHLIASHPLVMKEILHKVSTWNE